MLGSWVALALIAWIFIPYTGSGYTWVTTWLGFLPAAMIWIVIDRASGRLKGISEREEWLYFLVFPRFVAPFVQPLGAARFLRSRRLIQSPRLSLRALLLGVYTIAVFYAMANTHFSVKSSWDALSAIEHGPRIARNAVHIYAYNAGGIFLAVTLLRLVGYDLGSGFNWPTLASSPGDFFRRWNYYFFEFCSAAIFLPIVSRLRRWLPLWLTYVIAAYACFALGVFALGIIGNVPGDYLGTQTLKALTNPWDLRAHLAMWSMAIGAQLLIMPLRRWRRSGWSRVFGNLGTWALVIAGLIALFVTQYHIY
jgi:hypothetical protein